MKRVILVHGMSKTPQDIWYPYIQREAEARGLVCSVPDMGQSENPILEEWLRNIDSLSPDPDTILVGHSRGGMAILRWLEVCQIQVKRVILVAANNADIEDQAKGDFYFGPYKFEEIKKHCSDFVLMYSEDDPWMPYEAGLKNQEGLGGRMVRFKDKGHFVKQLDDSTMTEFPELVEEIMR